MILNYILQSKYMIDKITKDFLEKIIFEIKKEDNKKMINDQIIYPILNDFCQKIYPYLTVLFTMYLVNIILIIIILYLVLFNKNKKI